LLNPFLNFVSSFDAKTVVENNGLTLLYFCMFRVENFGILFIDDEIELSFDVMDLVYTRRVPKLGL
jgi:hypothetical protein